MLAGENRQAQLVAPVERRGSGANGALAESALELGQAGADRQQELDGDLALVGVQGWRWR
jgi:hypothetical protein